jgi:hypothetical protein
MKAAFFNGISAMTLADITKPGNVETSGRTQASETAGTRHGTPVG